MGGIAKRKVSRLETFLGRSIPGLDLRRTGFERDLNLGR